MNLKGYCNIGIIGTTGLLATRCTTGTEEKVNCETGDKPNIILVMADDQGWGDVAYNGNSIVKTPSLDQMAKDGIRLDRFYAAAPVCSPTRASCLTGRHPYRYNIPWAGDGHLPHEEVTIAESLKKANYATGHFGKWHVGQLSKTVKQSYFPGDKSDPKQYSAPWTNGFDECFTTESMMPTYNPYYHDCGEFSVREGDNQYQFIMDKAVEEGTTTGVRWRDHYWTGPGQFIDENLPGDDSAIIMDRALKFIKKNADNNQQFFSCIWFHTPHTPIVAGNDSRAIYANLTIDKLNGLMGKDVVDKMVADEGEAKVIMRAQHWFGALSAMDKQVGRLRSELRKMGIADNTMIIFCSDNGPSYIHNYNSAGHFSGKKATLLEGGVRVPGIVEWPSKLKGGKIVKAAMSTCDIYPTCLKAAGLKLKYQPVLDGIDMMPMLTGEQKSRPTPIGFQSPVKSDKNVYAEKGSKAITWHDGKYKLSSYNSGKKWMLFDLEKDPAEKNDISKKNKKRVKKMVKAAMSWIKSCSRSAEGLDYK